MTSFQGGFCKITSKIFKLNQTCATRANLHPCFMSTRPIALVEPERSVTCTLIPGDGVGAELINSVRQVFDASKIPVKFEYFFLSEAQPELSAPLDQVVESVMKNGVCLKGILSNPLSTVIREGMTTNMKLRRSLDLFANVVHIRSLAGLQTRHADLDFIIIRESVEGEYSALEHEGVEGVVECLKIVTRFNSRRIAKFAFDYATKLGRKRVTAVHKANIMKLGDGLFLNTCSDIAKLYPKIEFSNMIIDNCTMQMVSNPHQFDVMVMPNLYGDIIANLAAGLVGGAGLVTGESYGQDYVMFEPGARHTFAKAAGTDTANPTAMLLSACNMLRHVNLPQHGKRLREAVQKVIRDGRVRTKDMKGNSTCSEFTRAVIENLK